jgi:tetrahydromethanopterin S-methyltransferase subunit G
MAHAGAVTVRGTAGNARESAVDSFCGAGRLSEADDRTTAEDLGADLDGKGGAMTDDLTKTLNGDSAETRIMARLDEMEAKIDDRLSALEAEVADRKRETRPIWEQALAEILALSEQSREIIRRLDEMRDGFEIVGGELLAIKTKQKHLETRVRTLEDGQQPQ